MSEEYRNTVRRTVLLLLIAFVGIVGISFAWFTLADFTKVSTMKLDITNGSNLRFDVVAHDGIEDYYKTLSVERIRDYVLGDHGYDLTTTPLQPVTTADCVTYTFEDGEVAGVNTGVYVQFPLHFMAAKDMYVHLTTANSPGNTDGTQITSDDARLTNALRICFTVNGNNYIYSPGMGEGATQTAIGKVFGLNDADTMVYSDNNSLFFIPAFTDQQVDVKIWLEGTDEGCVDDIKKLNFTMKFRFAGTDEDNVLVE